MIYKIEIEDSDPYYTRKDVVAYCNTIAEGEAWLRKQGFVKERPHDTYLVLYYDNKFVWRFGSVEELKHCSEIEGPLIL